MHSSRRLSRDNCYPIGRDSTAIKGTLADEAGNHFPAFQIPDFETVVR
jgi:hypothetical protein